MSREYFCDSESDGAECEITGFPRHPKTQWESQFFYKDFRLENCKNQVLGKIDSRFQLGKPERFSESQFFGVAFRMETRNILVISHPVVDV